MLSPMKLSEISNVLIISHFYKRTTAGGGPPQEIRDYFLPRIKKIYYIEHPFPYAKDHRSSMTIYEEGVLKKQIFTPSIKGPETVFYLIDVFLTFYFLLRAKTKFDLCIALDNLNTVSVLPFKKLGLIKKLVFYTIDYNPQRFGNKVLNNIYHFLDRLACYHADKIWILSERMIAARKQNGVDTKKMAPSILLPMGANLQRIKILPIKKINRYDLVFAGYLSKRQGVQIVLEALPKIISEIPKARFLIIGQGEYGETLKRLSKQLNISDHVKFKGFIENQKDLENILCKSTVAIAPYVPKKDNFAFFTDPGKPKLYLGCGLPVVITNVPAIAGIIQSKKAGIVVDYNKESVAKALITLLTNDELYKKYRKNVIKLSKNYDTNTLIAKALDKTS